MFNTYNIVYVLNLINDIKCYNSKRTDTVPKCGYEIAMKYTGSGTCDFNKQESVQPYNWEIVSTKNQHKTWPSCAEELKKTLEHSQLKFCVFSLEYFFLRYGRSTINSQSFRQGKNKSGDGTLLDEFKYKI